MGFLDKFFAKGSQKVWNRYSGLVKSVDAWDETLRGWSEEQLRARIGELRERVAGSEPNKRSKMLEELLPEVFAITREAAGRTLGMRHFPVQLIGGAILHEGKIAEMATGEGKTLVATLPVVLNALTGQGVHVVTVNDYLARRDSEWMGHVYRFLGLSVGLVVPRQPTEEKKQAYASDILYATNNEIGFDYLRDNMVMSLESQVRRPFHYAIVDEVDSVLVDEARTPLIISGMPEQGKGGLYQAMEKLARQLQKSESKEDPKGDYYTEEKNKNVVLTDKGIRNVEAKLEIDDLWSHESNTAHHLLQALKAKEFFRRDSEYVVHTDPQANSKEIVIVDEFTGRLMHGRRWSEGLHQAIEAKEGVPIQEESQTQASITFQNLFRMYPKLAGMTGTALTEAEEFGNIYNLEVVPIPTNKPNIRQDLNDKIYKNQHQKLHALVEEIIYQHRHGRPVLVGTTNIEKSEMLSEMLSKPEKSLKLLKQRYQRLRKTLEKAEENDLVKQLAKFMDRPMNVRLSEGRRILSEATVSDKTRKALDKSLNTEEELTDSDVAAYAQSFLRSCMCVEEIRQGINHSVLNAKHHAREAHIIAQAGRIGAVTIATNMAGRGTDILLGGNPDYLLEDSPQELSEHSLHAAQNQTAYEHEQVVGLGGLCVIGSERHESRRIDNQLRGRAGRQGDPGSTRFYLALDDNLMRIFGGDRLTNAMNFLNYEEDLALEASFVSKGIERAQSKVESHYSEIRKRLFEYDGVQDTQRKVIFEERQRILEGREDLSQKYREMAAEYVQSLLSTYINPEQPPEVWWEALEEGSSLTPMAGVLGTLKLQMPQVFARLEGQDETLADLSYAELEEHLIRLTHEEMEAKEQELGPDILPQAQKHVLLRTIDEHWVDNLRSLEALREGIHLRGYAQKQPLLEYKTEALNLFDRMIEAIRQQAAVTFLSIEAVRDPAPETVPG